MCVQIIDAILDIVKNDIPVQIPADPSISKKNKNIKKPVSPSAPANSQLKIIFKWILFFARIVVIIGLAYLSYLAFAENKRDKEIKSNIGHIEARANFSYPTLHIGGDFRHNLIDLQFEHELTTSIKAHIENGRLIVDANIRDSHGNGLAYLSDGIWYMGKSDIQYNNDNTGYEMITLDGRVIFQLDLKNDTVFCKGLICGEKGTCIYAYDTGFYTIKKDLTNSAQFDIPEGIQIPHLFLYPRELHLGERVINKNK
jgi:hypothetical protein